MLDLKTIGIKSGSNQFGQISLFELVFLAAGFDAREIKDVVDKRGEAFALFANNAKVFFVLFLRGKAAEFQRFRIKANERQRSAKLVRDVGDEVRFQSGELHFARNVAMGKEYSTCHDQRERCQNKIVVPEKFRADFVNGGAGVFDGKNHALKNIAEGTLHLRLSAVPTRGSDPGSGALERTNHHGGGTGVRS